MKSLYVTSIESYTGKTAVCLGLGRHWQSKGLQVGYLKPLSLQPYRVAGQIADEDAAFVQQVLGLAADPWELSPVVVTQEMMHACLAGELKEDLMEKVVTAVHQAGEGKDILILEGGGSLREGYFVGLPTPDVALKLGSKVLVIVRYHRPIQVIDDALTAQKRLGEMFGGVLINRVPEEVLQSLPQEIIPYLRGRGVETLGYLPESRSLAALTVGELVEVLGAEVLTDTYNPEAMVRTLTVGAMTADAALSRFRLQSNKAVITGGDRTDIQLAALETSTTCLILTGYLRPSPLIIKQAEEFGVSVLLVRDNTMETIEAIEKVYGKTRLGQRTKLELFQQLLNEQMDFERLNRMLGLG